ncbi:hypothetical protein DU508_17005 [Pedobacter chinensis]|uniref:ABM domain-containing protein n=1 Tax=Pedobacter chinensis TaxID=2282421 RepID=A0A369PRW6_9SPHI|nr:antibiotic biosynthesis monooxygenase [Pedobacter chinensis]RDC55274.1 hypothetical protein DU508_17005 [Pedobacter chinensis]
MKTKERRKQIRNGWIPNLTFGIISLLMITGCNQAESNKNKIDTTDDGTEQEISETFQELGFFGEIKKEKWNDFVQAVQNNVSHSRQESGNLAFSLYQPADGKYEAFWFERFENKQAHNFHKEQDYFKNAISVIQQSLAREAKSIELKEVNEIPAREAVISQNPELTRNVIVLFDVKPDKRQSFINTMREVTLPSRNAIGNLEFNLYQYVNESNKFVLIESWKNADDHKAHLEQEYSKKMNKLLEDIFASNPMHTRWLVKDISVNK